MDVSRPIFTDSTGIKILNAINDVAMRPDIVDNLTTNDPDKVLSARQGKVLNDAKYEKPSTGIPKTDLSSDVQSLLADFGASGASHSSGLVPDPGATAGTEKYLREDGTWAIPEGSGGEENVIESISVNGTEQTVDVNKNVDITVPVVATSISDGETGYATGDQVYDYVQANKGDINVIETVKVNGSALTPDSNKAVDVTVPVVAAAIADSETGYTTGDQVYDYVQANKGDVNIIESISLDNITQSVSNKVCTLDLSAYAKLTDISSVLKFKGTKTSDELEALTGMVEGDVYQIIAGGTGTTYKVGSEYAYNGTSWFELGPAIDLSGYVQKTQTVNGKALSGNIVLDGSDVALTGYTEASSASAVAATDTVNQAIGKVEKKVDDSVENVSNITAAVASAFIELNNLIQYLAFTSGNNNAQDTIEALSGAISVLGNTAIINKNLTGCTLSNPASSISLGSSYTSSLVRNEEVFMFSSVTIRMSGVDITSSAWDVTTETISISSVTGPVSITAVANVVLPTGYTRLSYIAADGNQYTVLNTEEGDATRAVYEVMVTGQTYRKGNHILSGYRTYFPFLRTTSGGDGELGATNRGNETAASGDSKLYNWSFNQRYKLEGFVGEDEVLKVDGTTIYSLPRGGSQDLTTPLAIFDYRGPGGGSQDYKFRGRLYSMSIYGSNGTLLKKLVPCKNASNVAGLYDLVEDIFYTSDTATAYIAGEEV